MTLIMSCTTVILQCYQMVDATCYFYAMFFQAVSWYDLYFGMMGKWVKIYCTFITFNSLINPEI